LAEFQQGGASAGAGVVAPLVIRIADFF